MLRYFILLLIFIFGFTDIHSQKIYGTIRDEHNALLPYSTILLKGSSKGTSSNNDAFYSLPLETSKTYHVVCSQVGYRTQEKIISITKDTEVNFVLKQEVLLLDNVVVSSKGEDPAYAIIRHAIDKREYHNKQVKSFQCDYYSKDLIKLRKVPEKIFGQKIEDNDRRSMGLDSAGKGIIYLSESVSEIFSEQPGKFKMNVKSSRVSGSNGFGFNFPVFINLYTNHVNLFEKGLNSRGFVSPIADGALNFYKYKLLGTFEESGRMIYSIKVAPKRNFEPLFSGVINISDQDWHFQSFDLMLTKDNQMELIDTMHITQMHVPLDKDVWRVKNQLMYFNVKLLGIDAIGNFLSVYSDYKINPVFDKKIFDKVIIKYDTAVNKRTRVYWDSIRPVPLNTEESKDYSLKDSLMKVRQDSMKINSNIDSLKKHQGKINWVSLPMSGISRTHYSKKGNYNWGMEGLLTNIQYNSVEGVNTQLKFRLDKYCKLIQSKLDLNATVRYGFSNQHLNLWMDVRWQTHFLKESFGSNKQYWNLSGGKSVQQFNVEYPIDPLLNSWSTLMNGRNLMKIYEQYFVSAGYERHFENGWTLNLKLSYEDRIPLQNTSRFTFRKSDTVLLTPNVPVGRIVAEDIYRHQALLAGFNLTFQPGQHYIQFPHTKMALGSQWPVFGLGFQKAIPGIAGSDADFEKWNTTVTDELNMKLAGKINYKLELGGFLRRRQLMFQDYKHFNANTVSGLGGGANRFKLMDTYLNSNDERFYAEGHLDYHLNGLLTNKLPLLKKWKWYLVAGSNAYWIRNTDHYEEYSIGLENIFKIFRVDYVTAYQNGKPYRSSIVLGAGGLLGSGGGKSGSGKQTVSINF